MAFLEDTPLKIVFISGVDKTVDSSEKPLSVILSCCVVVLSNSCRVKILPFSSDKALSLITKLPSSAVNLDRSATKSVRLVVDLNPTDKVFSLSPSQPFDRRFAVLVSSAKISCPTLMLSLVLLFILSSLKKSKKVKPYHIGKALKTTTTLTILNP